MNKYNVAVASSDRKVISSFLTDVGVVAKVQQIRGPDKMSFTHFWLESSLSFSALEARLRSSKSSWFLANDNQKSTSSATFPQLIRTLEQITLTCDISAVFATSFQEAGSLSVFDDYVQNFGCRKGIASGREFYFNSANPVIQEMHNRGALELREDEAFITYLTFSFSETPDENVRLLAEQVAADVEANAAWYTIETFPAPINKRRGRMLSATEWIPQANERDRIFYSTS